MLKFKIEKKECPNQKILKLQLLAVMHAPKSLFLMKMGDKDSVFPAWGKLVATQLRDLQGSPTNIARYRISATQLHLPHNNRHSICPNIKGATGIPFVPILKVRGA